MAVLILKNGILDGIPPRVALLLVSRLGRPPRGVYCVCLSVRPRPLQFFWYVSTGHDTSSRSPDIGIPSRETSTRGLWRLSVRPSVRLSVLFSEVNAH